MKEIYLFRHGATYFSKNEIPYGNQERSAHILPESTRSVEKIAKHLSKLEIKKALRSEFVRCVETAQIVESITSIQFIPDPLLNEFVEKDFSLFEKRMEALSEKINALPVGAIALCTHGAVIAGLKCLLVGKKFTTHELRFYPKTGVLVKIEGNNISETDFNE